VPSGSGSVTVWLPPHPHRSPPVSFAASMPHCESSMAPARPSPARANKQVASIEKEAVCETLLEHLSLDRAGVERLAQKKTDSGAAPRLGCVLMNVLHLLGQHGGIHPDFSRMRVARPGSAKRPRRECSVSSCWWRRCWASCLGGGRSRPRPSRFELLGGGLHLTS